MKISIIIIGYNGDRWLPKCIESLQPHTTHQLEVVLVDNWNNPGLSDLDFKGLEHRIIKPPKVCGFAEANNFAFVNGGCESDAVVLLNQDTWSESDWIPRCADVLDQKPKLGAISPTVRQYDNDRHDPNFAECLSLASGETDDPTYQQLDKAPAVALVVRTKTLIEAGPFDPVFGSYYEDYDLCARIHRAGYEIGYDKTCWVRHFSGSASLTPEAQLRRTIQVVRNRLIYELRFSGIPRTQRLLRYFVLQFPRNLARGIVRTPSSQPLRATFKATYQLLQLLPRIRSDQGDLAAWEDYLAQIQWPSPAAQDGETPSTD